MADEGKEPMGELIPFPDKCAACASPDTRAYARSPSIATPVLCRVCANRLRKGIYGLLPKGHQDYVSNVVLEACIAEAARKVRYQSLGSERATGEIIRSRAGDILSQVAVRAFRQAEEGLESHAAVFVVDAQDPSRDGRVIWLLAEIASRRSIAQRGLDAWREEHGWVRESKKAQAEGTANQAAAGGDGSQGAKVSGPRYRSALDIDLETGGIDPTFRLTPPTPHEDQQAMEHARNAKHASYGLYLLLTDAYGSRDDAVVVYRLMIIDPDLSDMIGPRQGRGSGLKLPAGDIADALQASASLRPWDNKPWTERRVETTRQKLGRFAVRLAKEQPDPLLHLAEVWTNYCRVVPNP